MDDKSGKPLPSGGVEQKKDVKPVSVPATASKEQNATGSAQEEAMKKMLAQMVNDDPASVAEIIHMWLNEDKNRNG